MACSVCVPTKSPYTCGDTLELGIVSVLFDDVYVFVKNMSNGYEYRQLVTTAIDGTVVYDVTVPGHEFYNPNSTYEIKVTDLNDVLLPITIGADVSDCFLVTFRRARDENGDMIGPKNQIIELE